MDGNKQDKCPYSRTQISGSNKRKRKGKQSEAQGKKFKQENVRGNNQSKSKDAASIQYPGENSIQSVKLTKSNFPSSSNDESSIERFKNGSDFKQKDEDAKNYPKKCYGQKSFRKNAKFNQCDKNYGKKSDRRSLNMSREDCSECSVPQSIVESKLKKTGHSNLQIDKYSSTVKRKNETGDAEQRGDNSSKTVDHNRKRGKANTCTKKENHEDVDVHILPNFKKKSNKCKYKNKLYKSVKKKYTTREESDRPTFNTDKYTTSKTLTSSKAKSSSRNEDDECLVIPGFYYDKEKKRYFKIQPNHSNISSTVTREIIKKKEKEEKRLNDLAAIAQKSYTVSSLTPKKQAKDLPHILFSQGQGDISSVKMDNLFLTGRISNLTVPSPLRCVEIFREPIAYERLEHMLQIEVNYEHDQILGLWSVKDSLLQRIQLLKLCEKYRRSEREPLSLSIGTTGRTVIQSLNKVTNLCWADIPGDSSCSNILYTLMCHTGDHYSLARIRSLSIERDAQNNYFDFNLGLKAVWTCAWNGYAKQFSVGSEKSSLLIDVNTRRLWELNTNSSDTLSQVFSQQSSPCLYSGTRKGQVLTHDLRSISTRPVSVLSMSSSVCCLKMLQDDTSMLASDVKGKISLWDLRMKKILIEYKGCRNEYSRIPVHTDETERLVYGAGQDGYVRFWCLKTGRCLRSLPPPVETDIDTIPAVKYSERWGNRQGNAGLVMGICGKIYKYPSFTANFIT